MDWQNVFTKKRILLICLVAITAISFTELYVNSPSILLWLNPRNTVTMSDVIYPTEAYRSQNLPVTVELANTGDAKDVLIEIASTESPTLSSNIRLDGGLSNSNTTIWLPLKAAGNQSFSIKVTWTGPGGYCKIYQDSIDKQFRVLAADYQMSSPSIVASRAQGFDWTLSVTNCGNTAADLMVQLNKKDPLILSDSSGGTQQISNLQVGETRSVGFHFDVPKDAGLGDHILTVTLTTKYPDTAYYKDCTEVTSQNFNYNIQESPIKTQLDSASYLVDAALGAVGIGGIGTFFALFTKKKRGR